MSSALGKKYGIGLNSSLFLPLGPLDLLLASLVSQKSVGDLATTHMPGFTCLKIDWTSVPLTIYTWMNLGFSTQNKKSKLEIAGKGMDSIRVWFMSR